MKLYKREVDELVIIYLASQIFVTTLVGGVTGRSFGFGEFKYRGFGVSAVHESTGASVRTYRGGIEAANFLVDYVPESIFVSQSAAHSNSLTHVFDRRTEGNSPADQKQCEQGDANGCPITPYFNIKWRRYLECAAGIFAVLFGLAGLWYIESAGLVKDVSIRNAARLCVGIVFLVIAWMMLHAGLDLFEFGRIYSDHLIV